MLVNLYVENLALIERLELELGPGFNVLTGETGAGKSLVVDAVNLLLGARASSEFIRTGAERALVQGIFACPDRPQLAARLEEMGISLEDDGTLVLSRELNRSGRNVCRVGGRVLGLAAYQEIGRYLVDVHGQHEHQSLLEPQAQLLLLDAYGGQPLLALRQATAEAWRRWQEAEAALATLKRQQEEEDRLKDLWEFQAAEIRAARLRPGEEEELEAEVRLLSAAEQLAAAAESAYQLTFAGTGGASAYDLVSRAAAHLKPVQGLDPALAEVVRGLEEAACLIEDKAAVLRDYRQRLDFSPSRLAELQARLDLIRQLRRKYGGTVEDVLRLGEELAARLAALQDRSERLDQAERERAAAEAEYRERAARLAQARREAAGRLEQDIGAVLAELNMPNTVFVAALRAAPPGPSGTEEVEFAFSANPGEPPRPVAKIASGGELSRLMLALKSIMAEDDAIPTLIFDEVDAGLGGAAARAVGKKLQDLSRWHQVICVTHAAQIAAYADRHFRISKEEVAGRTLTLVNELDEPGRVAELARMLAGRVDEASLHHARQLLAECAGRK